MLSIIVAIAENNAIGNKGNLLTYLPNDLKWFKKNTTGKTIIMGRKTFESLPNGALPNRKNIVLTNNPDFKAENCLVFNDYLELLENLDTNEDNLIIGGAEIYKLFFPLVDKLFITRIYADFEADVFFPEINFEDWNLLEKTENKTDERHKFDFDFFVYENNNHSIGESFNQAIKE